MALVQQQHVSENAPMSVPVEVLVPDDVGDAIKVAVLNQDGPKDAFFGIEALGRNRVDRRHVGHSSPV